MNSQIKLLLVFWGIVLISCEKEYGKNVDGRVFVITQGVKIASEMGDRFSIGEGEVKWEGKPLSDDFWIVSKGLIYGTDFSMLEIKSHFYDIKNYNQRYGCLQTYTYTTLSSVTSIINVRIETTYWKEDGRLDGYDYCEARGFGKYACLLSDLRKGTRYYYRSFAHISDEKGFDKYLYGDVKEFISGGITQDPTVFIPIDALGIGVMKEDLLQPGIGLNAIRACMQFNFDGGIGGYTDWQVPTIAQLREIYKLRDQIGGFKETWYYSCEEGESPYYYYWDFATNTQGCEQLNNYTRHDGYVRLVRNLP